MPSFVPLPQTSSGSPVAAAAVMVAAIVDSAWLENVSVMHRLMRAGRAFGSNPTDAASLTYPALVPSRSEAAETILMVC